jgi:hypothetical protein
VTMLLMLLTKSGRRREEGGIHLRHG